MNDLQDPNPFIRLIRLTAALDPWLGQIVIVGGWAHQLYRLHPHAQALDYPRYGRGGGSCKGLEREG